MHLVGAGPGDPDLLTRKAYALITSADVIVYDRLVSDEILRLIPRGTPRINVGKQPKSHPIPQDEINQLLVRLATEGRVVVRLKGGDPFLFGRGGEEIAFLREHNIRCDVVPGVTSASACAAAVGIPLTHRGLASGVRYVTGHGRDNANLDLDWHGLADPDTTLVVYMGTANLPTIAIRLIAAGLPATTPAAAICSGTRPSQRHVVATLGDIAGVASAAHFEGPVLFVIGRVVNLLDPIANKADAKARDEAVIETEVG